MTDLIIYNAPDGRCSVALYAKDGNVWLNQSQIAELFATSKQTISYHVNNILNDSELERNAVVKYYLTTASDGKEYNVEYYSLQMIYKEFNERRKKLEAGKADAEDQTLLDNLESLQDSIPVR